MQHAFLQSAADFLAGLTKAATQSRRSTAHLSSRRSHLRFSSGSRCCRGCLTRFPGSGPCARNDRRLVGWRRRLCCQCLPVGSKHDMSSLGLGEKVAVGLLHNWCAGAVPLCTTLIHYAAESVHSNNGQVVTSRPSVRLQGAPGKQRSPVLWSGAVCGCAADHEQGSKEQKRIGPGLRHWCRSANPIHEHEGLMSACQSAQEAGRAAKRWPCCFPWAIPVCDGSHMVLSGSAALCSGGIYAVQFETRVRYWSGFSGGPTAACKKVPGFQRRDRDASLVAN